MASITVNCELIDTTAKVRQAVRALRRCSKFSVDCEGVDLSRHGELCLLQIATSNSVYIFDIVTLGSEAFDLGLKEILEDTTVTKLFYDCREDCNALKHQYGVNVQGIKDLQILDLMKMKFEGRRHTFVSGLAKTMRFNLPGCGFSEEEKRSMHRAFDADKSLWKRRPLKQEYLKYAATDVFFLLQLEQKIMSKLSRLISNAVLEDMVKYASARYADFMRNNDKYAGNIYFRNPRIPINIIPEVTVSAGRVSGYKPIVEEGDRCVTCNQFTGCAHTKCARCLNIDSEHPK